MRAPLLLVMVAWAGAARLMLEGESSELSFGSNGAVLNARCPSVGPASLDLAASWTFLEPMHSGVRVHLVGVPNSCAGLGLTVPCASVSPYYPRLFHCAWSAGAQEKVQTIGRAASVSKELDGAGDPTGANQVSVTCPLPSPSEFADLAGSTATDSLLTLRLLHTVPYTPEPHTRTIAFAGVPRGNEVRARLVDGQVAVSGVDEDGTAASRPTWLTLTSSYPSESGDLLRVGASAALHVETLHTSDLNATSSVLAESVHAGSVLARGAIEATNMTATGTLHALAMIASDGIDAASVNARGVVSAEALHVSGAIRASTGGVPVINAGVAGSYGRVWTKQLVTPKDCTGRKLILTNQENRHWGGAYVSLQGATGEGVAALFTKALALTQTLAKPVNR